MASKLRTAIAPLGGGCRPRPRRCPVFSDRHDERELLRRSRRSRRSRRPLGFRVSSTFECRVVAYRPCRGKQQAWKQQTARHACSLQTET